MDPNLPNNDPYANNSLLEKTDSNGVYFRDKLSMLWDKIRYVVVRITPFFQRIIATILFYTIKIVKGFFKIALDQLRFK